MANARALHSVGNSIATLLRSAYPQPGVGDVQMPACTFESMALREATSLSDDDTHIGLLLYRVTVSEHSRRPLPTQNPNALSLDLHYLLTAFAATAEDEQIPLAWAMRQLHLHPLLDASSLSPEAGWQRDDVIQIVPQELGIDEQVRIWDALDASYRLSAAYVARVVRLDPDTDAQAFAPVVARDFAYGPGGRP
ncbi:DUF4255 domain-containing protein [Variovorax robiniae]|uniref:DUF4255 domain-containing protein n=1 Tax=Variovorax robiniae TaxID=1836199 RepID=A0ABU8X019_9BURK